MGQPVRNKDKPTAYYETLKDRINAGNAVHVLNGMLAGEKRTAQEERAAYFTLNKLLPNLQAIAVQVEHKVSANWQEIQAQALEAGIDPKLLIPKEKAAIEHERKSDSAQDHSEAPLPPEADT